MSGVSAKLMYGCDTLKIELLLITAIGNAEARSSCVEHDLNISSDLDLIIISC